MRRISLESQRRFALVVGSLVTLYVGSLFIFVYEHDVENRFNASQTNMAMLWILKVVGVSLGLSCDQIFLRIRSVSIMNMALLCGVLCDFISFLASHYYLDFFRQQFWAIMLCYTINAFACGLLFIVPFSVSTNHFPARYHARIFGFIGGLFWLGPAISLAIYDVAFAPSKNIDGYVLTRALIGLVVNILALIFMTLNPHGDVISTLHIPNDRLLQDRSDDSTKLAIEDSGSKHSSSNCDGVKPEIGVSNHLTEMGSLGENYILLISLGFINDATLSINYVYLIGIILDTYSHQELLTVLTLAVPLVACIIKVYFASDKNLPNHPETALPLITLSGSFQVIFTQIFVRLFKSGTLIFLFPIFTLLFSFMPVILNNSFDVEYLTANIGMVVIVSLYVILVILSKFIYSYDL